jgi:hypothetical protein
MDNDVWNIACVEMMQGDAGFGVELETEFGEMVQSVTNDNLQMSIPSLIQKIPKF